MVKKRLSDGILVSLNNWNLLPDNELKKFEDVQIVELPKAIQERINPIVTEPTSTTEPTIIKPKRGRRRS